MRRASTQKWLLIQFCLVIVLPSILIFLAANYLYVNVAIDQQVRSKRLVLNEIKHNIDTKLKFFQRMTLQLYLNEAAMAELEDRSPIGECVNIQAQLDSYVNSNPYIANAYVFCPKGVISSGHGIKDMEAINGAVQGRLGALEGKIYWHSSGWVKSLFGMEQYGVFGSRHIRKNWMPIATLHIGLRDTFFFGDFSDGGGGSDSQGQPFFVCDEDGIIIATTGSSLKPGDRLLSRDEFSRVRSSPEPLRCVDPASGIESLALGVSSQESAWTVTTLLYPKEIARNVRVVMNIFSVAIVIFALYLLSISIFLTRRFSQPLRDLSSTIGSLGHELRALPVSDGQTTEIRLLCESFNTMTERIRKLMEEVKAEEKAKRRVYMQTLQLQLTPHFLYNALNTIGWMADMNGQVNIREITRALSSFLKQVSAIDSGFILLGEELDLLEDYAVIQRYRYTDFELRFDVSEELRSLYVHKLMLINLMENSVVHAFSEGSARNIIRVKARREDGRLTIRFSDNGSGFDTAEFKRRPRSRNTSIGLRNTLKRIRLYHGENYGMKLRSSPGKGCTVIITLPAMDRAPD